VNFAYQGSAFICFAAPNSDLLPTSIRILRITAFASTSTIPFWDEPWVSESSNENDDTPSSQDSSTGVLITPPDDESKGTDPWSILRDYQVMVTKLLKERDGKKTYGKGIKTEDVRVDRLWDKDQHD